MTAMAAPFAASFVDALVTPSPAADRAEKMALYGQFVGRWEMDAVRHPDNGATLRSRGEIHFAWALQGRAVQDVWMVPARETANAGAPKPGDFYGTTIRVYDPGRDFWHIFWIDPLTQTYRRMIGRAEGRDIVQEGTDEAGIPVRWSFRDITPASFHWMAERSLGQDAGFRLLVEFFARRVG